MFFFAHWCSCPLAASPTLFIVEANSSVKIHLNINVTSYGSIFPFVCLVFVCFFQAFLGDLFQQHHKNVLADKLEEYTDTMVVLDFIIMLNW